MPVKISPTSIFALLTRVDLSAAAIRDNAWAQVVGIIEPAAKPIRVIRPDDFLAIDFYLYNLKLDVTDNPKLVRLNPAKPAYLVAQFQGQSFGEQAYFDSGSPATSDTLPALPTQLARAHLSGPSRISFQMPTLQASLDYTLEALLDACRKWPMKLDPLAAPLPEAFSDDLPIRGRSLDFHVNANALWNAVAGGVLTQANFSNVRTQFTAMLSPAKAAAVARAAERAERTVVDSVLKNLRSGDLDGKQTKTFVERQSKAAAKAYGLRTVNDQRAVETLVLATLANEIARAGVGFDPAVYTVFPGILSIVLSPHKPSVTATSIEAPYRLYQSPIEPAGWCHALDPVAKGGRTELWHTRLTPKVANEADEKSGTSPMLRAIWSPDYKKEGAVNPFLMSLAPNDRSDIVRLTSGYSEVALVPAGASERYEPFVPKPTTARRLMLSSLGAWLDSDGFWNRRPAGVGLEAWRHLAAMGRDYYVRVVYPGYLFNLGHRAALIKITERMFQDIPGGNGRGAYLRQRKFIVVREPVKNYPGTNQRIDGRDFPFQRVEILTKVTPQLLNPGSDPRTLLSDLHPADPDAAFWPMYDPGNGSPLDVKFKIRATDFSGREVAFSMPLIFIKDAVNTATDIPNVISSYAADLALPTRSLVPLDGQTVELAPQVVDGDAEGDTVFPVKEIKFAGASPSTALPPNRPQFYPRVAEMKVVAPALARMGGLTDGFRVEYADIYKTSGFAPTQNTGQVFLKTLGDVDLSLGGGGGASNASVGGLVAPNMKVSALSRSKGAVGGNVNNFAGGQFDPGDFFPSAKLFGTIDLKDLIAPVAVTLIGAAVPKLLKVEFPDRVEISFQFRREDINSPSWMKILQTGAGGPSVLDITAKAIAYLHVDDPENPLGNFSGSGMDAGIKDPEAIVDASLTNFKLNMFGCVVVWFDSIHFKVKAGEKPDVDPKLHDDHPVVFGGPLEFVNKLSEILPSNGFSDPPVLSVDFSGIKVGYTLSLPNVPVGAFSLQNMSVGAVLRLPFDGDPISIRFNFCEREKPFLLTVSLFGGGGFFVISLDASGVREIEAALEFGAFAAIDLGVASGSVYVKAGIYFHWATDTVELEGYVEMGGELSVIGIISVSLTFHLSLGYYKSGGMSELKGQATLVVEVEVLFFSASVSVTAERRFGGSPADPLFVDFIPDQATWTRYADAFA